MKVYWIALYKKIDSQENIKNYADKSYRNFKKLWWKTLVRGGKFQTLEGERISKNSHLGISKL